MVIAMKVLLTVVLSLCILGDVSGLQSDDTHVGFFVLVLGALVFCITGTWVWL